jgi:hypothetical protein
VDDGIEVLKADHRRLEQLLDEFASDAGSRSASLYHRRHLANRIVAELAGHLLAEEQCLFPMVRELLPDADSYFDLEMSEQELLGPNVRTLAEFDPADSRFPPAVAQLSVQICGHIARQEGGLFGEVHRAAAPEQLAALGEQLKQAKQVTRAAARP